METEESVPQSEQLFATELKYFQELLRVLPPATEGMYAVICGQELAGLFYEAKEAYICGEKTFNLPFMVKQITRK